MAGSGSYVDVDEKNFSLSSPYSIIKTQFDNAQTFAQEAKNRTDAYLDQLEDTLQGLVQPDSSAIAAVNLPEILTPQWTNRPSLSDLDLDTTLPAMNVIKPTLITVPTIPTLDIPEIGFTAPAWAAITRPVLNSPVALGDRPSAVPVSIDEAPVLTLPTMSTLTDIIIPSAPSFVVPEFEAQVPLFDVQIPEGLNYEEPIYQSDIWVSLMAKILYDIQNGGTGIPEDVELGIWNRARARALEERTASIRQAEAKLGNSGLRLASGEYVSMLAELEADWARKMADLGYAISEEQAKLAQTNSHFIVEQGIKCEELLRKFFESQTNRVFEAQKQIVITNLEIYKGLLQEHNNRIEIFKSEGILYESKIKSVQAKLEAFKTAIEGAKVSAEVQSLLVDVYGKQLQAVETRVKLYAAQLESARLKLEINSQNIQAYKIEVDAYTAQLLAEKVKFEIYQAELDGEKSKAETYRSQVEAYTSFVGAKGKQADISIATSENVIKQNDALIEGYKADLQAYEVYTNSLVKALAAKVSGFEAETAAYSAETTGLTAYYAAKETEMRVLIESANFALKKATAIIESTTQGYVSLNSLKVEGYKGIAGVSAQLTAAALAGIHASASVGYSAGESFSENWSHGDQLNESHSFDETPT